jgi:ATP-dependent Zn protease
VITFEVIVRAGDAAIHQLKADTARHVNTAQLFGAQVRQLSGQVGELNEAIGRIGYGPPRRRGVRELITWFRS